MTGFRGSWAAAVNTTRKLPLLSHTITRMVAEYLLLFAVQTARRLPKRLRNKLTPRATTKPSVGLAWADGKVEDEAFSSKRIPPALADRFYGEERVHRIGSGIVLSSRGSSRDALPRTRRAHHA